MCGNFDYFQQQLPEKELKPSQSITTQLVKTRLKLSNTLNESGGEYKALQKNLLDDLHQHVESMERDNFLIRPHLQRVNEFSQRTRWNQVSNDDIEVINQLAELPNGLPTENEVAKRFDLLCLKVQLSLLNQTSNYTALCDQMRDLLQRLEQKRTIPMVKAKLPLIEEVQTATWWTDATSEMVENIRFQLRDLIKFIDREEQNIVYTDFVDELEDLEEVNVPTRHGFSSHQYRKKVEAYIRDNQNHNAIAKLKRNELLSYGDAIALEKMVYGADIVESRELFQKNYGNVNLKHFVREIVGLDRNAVKKAFSKYLKPEFDSNQIRFVEMIIDYLTQNGVLDPGMLYEGQFADLHQDGLDGVFGNDNDIEGIIAIVGSFNDNAGVKFDAV